MVITILVKLVLIAYVVNITMKKLTRLSSVVPLHRPIASTINTMWILKALLMYVMVLKAL